MSILVARTGRYQWLWHYRCRVQCPYLHWKIPTARAVCTYVIRSYCLEGISMEGIALTCSHHPWFIKILTALEDEVMHHVKLGDETYASSPSLWSSLEALFCKGRKPNILAIGCVYWMSSLENSPQACKLQHTHGLRCEICNLSLRQDCRRAQMKVQDKVEVSNAGQVGGGRRLAQKTKIWRDT